MFDDDKRWSPFLQCAQATGFFPLRSAHSPASFDFAFFVDDGRPEAGASAAQRNPVWLSPVSGDDAILALGR